MRLIGSKPRPWRVFRAPKTQRSRRQAQPLGLETAPRAKQSKFPSTWDDLVRSTYNSKNWKHYRRTQWKPA